jgi:transcription elongation factor Elf1
MPETDQEKKDGPWFVKTVRCPVCGHEQVSVANWRTRGLTCGGCGYYDPDYSWLAVAVEEQESNET